MKKISSIEVKRKFLEFFENNDHIKIVSSSIIPKNDPTLLFINSGMAPIKNYFTGVEHPKHPKLCNVQTCIRTVDIDSVGDRHHLTSFQMLGSWSINNYFKEKAISLAFDFLINVLKIPLKKIYVTVFSGNKNLGLEPDVESQKIWLKCGILEGHIIECGMKDNFWGPASITGPCGPCTEVFYDTSDELPELNMTSENFDTKNRYIEIWNAGVFMQLNKNFDQTFSNLNFKSVDTGAGLERLVMILNGYSSVYETDLLSPIKSFIEKELGCVNLPLRDVLILTDHLRTIVTILSEKISPSNEGRGYIPRKIIRRSMMIIAKNNINNFNFKKILNYIISEYDEFFPEFKKNKDHILNQFEKEQDQFEKVLISGINRLKLIKYNKKNISDCDTFDLVSTYGLPFDIIKDFAKENSMDIDEMGFKEKIKAHKNISRCSNNLKNENGKILDIDEKNFDRTKFVGYEKFICEATVLGVFEENSKKIMIVTDVTTMYAESGGQAADAGFIFNKFFKGEVKEVKKTKGGVFVHFIDILEGYLKVGDKVVLEVNEKRAQKIACNHTATHLLHAALREIFGKEVHQSGSKVEENKIRFDFNLEIAISNDDFIKIENLVNFYIRQNFERKLEIKSLENAIKEGATALFENKYSSNVRVVSFENVSSELCGGRHTDRTGNIGLFLIKSNEGIGKSIRRITAITGDDAIEFVHIMRTQMNNISKILKVKPDEIEKKLQKEIFSKKVIEKSCEINDAEVKFINNEFAYINRLVTEKKISDAAIKISEKIEKILICVLGKERKQIVVATPEKFINKYPANEVLKNILHYVNGKGGGNKKIANGVASCNLDTILKSLKI